MYGYFMDGSQFENSPEELAQYRREYLRIVKALKSRKRGEESEVDVRLTHQSLVVDNIGRAAKNFFCTFYVVEKMFKEVGRLVSRGSRNFSRNG